MSFLKKTCVILLPLAFIATGVFVAMEPCDKNDYEAVSSGRARGKWRAEYDQNEWEFKRLCNGLKEFEIVMEESPSGEFRTGTLLSNGGSYEFSLLNEVEAEESYDSWVTGEFIRFDTPPDFLTELSFRDAIELQIGFCLLSVDVDFLYVTFGNDAANGGTGYSFERQ